MGTRHFLAAVLATSSALYSGQFKIYPGAKIYAVEGKTKSYSTPDEFAKVRAFYQSIGNEEKMPEGDGTGWARASFTCDGGEKVVLSHPPPTNDPRTEQTFFTVQK
jgi:hypothetical protein